MPAARFSGPTQGAPYGSRVFVVIEQADGSRIIAEVLGAEVTISREWDDAPWWRGDLHMHPSLDSIDLHGVLGHQQAYRGDVPDEQREVEPTRQAIEGAAPIALGPGA